ncbi:MAG TPA: helix-turn-helix domain-containing protein [Actinomycetota bacterium]|nr:helix-turn-helix domain-containing protein [Actinomycetota bacterium]
MTVGLDGAVVEYDLRSGVMGCPVIGCGSVLGPWGWARERLVRGVGRLLPRRARCRGCRRTQVVLPASVLLRRADAATVIGAALLAKAGGAGHRPIAGVLNVPSSTVRGWLRRIVSVAERVLAVLAAAAAELGTEFTASAPTADPVAAVVEMLGALSAAVARRLGGSCSPWRLAAVLTGGRLLVPAGPELGSGWAVGRNTSSLWAAGP